MQKAFERPLPALLWPLLGMSLGVWVASVSRANFPTLSFIPPLARMGVGFALGMAVALLVFFIGSDTQKATALGVIGLYFIGTMGVIYEYPIMHDSLNNVTNLASVAEVSGPYGQSYAGFPVLIAWLKTVSGLEAEEIARLFPLGMLLLYWLVLGMMAVLWRKIILTSTFSVFLFVFFVLVFGDSFYLRINASPQTLAYLLHLVALALMPLSNRSILIKIFLLVTFAVIIMTHPVTPLLALPGLITLGIFSGQFEWRKLMLALQSALVFMVAYLTWTLYQAGWVLSNAVKFLFAALDTEKIIPIVGYTYKSNPELEAYLFWHRILLIAALAVLAVCYLLLFRSRTWKFTSLWGLAFLPAFVVFYSASEFFDRILLFAIIPCAVVFAEGITKIHYRWTKIRWAIVSLLIALSLLSGLVSYFSIGAVDRITTDEIEAVKYIQTLKPRPVYFGGFNIPLPAGYKAIAERRGQIYFENVSQANVVVVSPQMENAVFLNPRISTSVDDLLIFLAQNGYELAFSSGDVRVFVRKNP
jgi:hypothetical protein